MSNDKNNTSNNTLKITDQYNFKVVNATKHPIEIELTGGGSLEDLITEVRVNKVLAARIRKFLDGVELGELGEIVEFNPENHIQTR